jgi:hypothetical protein
MEEYPGPNFDNIQAQVPLPSVLANKPMAAPRGLNSRSCNTCRRRKVKCDKEQGGCGNCSKAHIQCVYPGPGRAPRKPKAGSVKAASERETELLKRLRRLEGVVEELSGQVEMETIRASVDTRGRDNDDCSSNNNNGIAVRVVGMDEGSNDASTRVNQAFSRRGVPSRSEEMDAEFGRLMLDEGKSRYVSNSFWARYVQSTCHT